MIDNFTPQPYPLWVTVVCRNTDPDLPAACVAVVYPVLGWQALDGEVVPLVQNETRRAAVAPLLLPPSVVGVGYVDKIPADRYLESLTEVYAERLARQEVSA